MKEDAKTVNNKFVTVDELQYKCIMTKNIWQVISVRIYAMMSHIMTLNLTRLASKSGMGLDETEK